MKIVLVLLSGLCALNNSYSRQVDTIPHHILSQSNLDQIQYYDLGWVYYNRPHRFEYPFGQDQAYSIWIVPEVVYHCLDYHEPGYINLRNQDNYYNEILFHYLLYDTESHRVLDHLIDDHIYSNDAVSIKGIEIRTGKEYRENFVGVEVYIQFGHNLRYIPYWTKRLLIIEKKELQLSLIFDDIIYVYHGEVGDSCEYYMNYSEDEFHLHHTYLVNGYYPIEVESISRIYEDGVERCGDLSRYNDTTTFTLHYEQGKYIR